MVWKTIDVHSNAPTTAVLAAFDDVVSTPKKRLTLDKAELHRRTGTLLTAEEREALNESLGELGVGWRLDAAANIGPQEQLGIVVNDSGGSSVTSLVFLENLRLSEVEHSAYGVYNRWTAKALAKRLEARGYKAKTKQNMRFG